MISQQRVIRLSDCRSDISQKQKQRLSFSLFNILFQIELLSGNCSVANGNNQEFADERYSASDNRSFRGREWLNYLLVIAQLQSVTIRISQTKDTNLNILFILI